MPRYGASKSIPSCNISKALLQEMEEYILRQGEKISGKKPEEIRSCYRFSIEDKFGEEELKSIGEYSRSHFSNDTRRIKLDLSYYGHPRVIIKVSLGLEKWMSRIEADIEASNAKELAMGIVSEISSFTSDYRNLNFIFDSPKGFVYGAGPASFFYFLVSVLTSLNKGELLGVDVLVVGFIFLFCLGFFVLSMLNPYCLFDTKRNETITRNTRWVLNALAAALVFSWIARKLMG